MAPVKHPEHLSEIEDAMPGAGWLVLGFALGGGSLVVVFVIAILAIAAVAWGLP